GVDGMGMVSQVIQIFDQYDFSTEVLVASVRSPMHMQVAAEMGADIATIPFKVMQQMTHHPLTDKGIKQFMDDWNKGQKK
ncbi:MAG TPA: transaldolase family protein, partial [Bdellovibrio sp.]|nr:transaldolase family protein [Bdellovibrio sp.]